MHSESNNSTPASLTLTEVESDQRWRTAFENSAIGIALLDLNGRFVTVNSSYQRMLGYTEEEFLAMSCLEITFEEDRASSQKSFSELLEGKRRHIQVEKRLLRKGNTPIWIRLSESLVPGTAGAAPFLLAVVEDITEQKHAQACIQRSELLYKEVLNNIPECVFALDVTSDSRFRLAWFNLAEERVVGRLSEEVVGRFIEDVLAAEVAEKVIRHYRRCLDSGALTEYEEELDFPAGRRCFHTSLIPVRNAEGQIYRIVGCCTDLTEMRRAQEEALTRQKLESLGVLAGGIAHDFNNLLGSILTNAELAETQLAEGHSAVEELQTIKTVALRSAEIVRELIVYAGQDQADLERTDVSGLVEEMLQLLKVSISKRATLKTDLGTQLPAVLANPAQVRQIVMNLIVNASESLGEKEGVISVTTSVESRGEEQVRGGDVQLPSGEYVRLQVSDTGCGISDPARARMFDPFFTTKFAGRGLGLAVVQGIVRARGGAIDVASTPGQGTTFTILLPSASESSGQPASAAIPALGGQHAPTIGTVLFVEDEESLRFAVSKMLRKTGFSVIEAADGRRAFELLESDLKIDVLFLDMTVPGTPSSAVIDKAMRTRPEITILLTSAYHQETVMKGIQSPQIRAFLRKPFRLDELVPLLKNGLASKPVDARLAWTQTES